MYVVKGGGGGGRYLTFLIIVHVLYSLLVPCRLDTGGREVKEGGREGVADGRKISWGRVGVGGILLHLQLYIKGSHSLSAGILAAVSQ